MGCSYTKLTYTDKSRLRELVLCVVSTDELGANLDINSQIAVNPMSLTNRSFFNHHFHISSKSIGPSEPPHPMKMLIALVEKASGFNSRDLRDVGFLFYLLTRHFQKGLTRHLKVTLHTSGPLSFLRCEPYIFRTT